MGTPLEEALERGQADGAAGGYEYHESAYSGREAEAYKAGWMMSKAQFDQQNGNFYSYDGNEIYAAAWLAAAKNDS